MSAAKGVASALRNLAFLSGGAGALLAFENYFLYNVDGGERVVMYSRFDGVQKDVIGEGTHFRIPEIHTPHYYDVKSRPRIINTRTGTKDLQMIKIALRILSRPDEERLPEIHKNLGVDYDERVLPSIGNEVLKAVVAQYNADELLTKRDKVSADIKQGLTRRAQTFGLLLDDVAITALSFTREFAEAVEFKQVAQQEAERAKFVVEKSKQEQRVKIIQAEGESEAAELISKALKKSGRGVIEVQRIDAAKHIANQLSRSRNVAYLPGGGKDGSNLLLQVGTQ